MAARHTRRAYLKGVPAESEGHGAPRERSFLNSRSTAVEAGALAVLGRCGLGGALGSPMVPPYALTHPPTNIPTPTRSELSSEKAHCSLLLFLEKSQIKCSLPLHLRRTPPMQRAELGGGARTLPRVCGGLECRQAAR